MKPSFKPISQTQASQNHRNLFSFFPCAENCATFSIILLFFPCVLCPKWAKLGHLFPSQNGHVSLLHPTSFGGRKGNNCMTHWVFTCLPPAPPPSKTCLSWVEVALPTGKGCASTCHPGCLPITPAHLLCFSYLVVTARVCLPWGPSVMLWGSPFLC